MGTHVIKMPDIGEGIAEVELSVWHVKVGDLVVEDQVLADVMTDKAMVDIPSPVHGKVISLGGEPGEVMAVGSILISIEVEGAGNTKDVPVVAEPVKAAPVADAETGAGAGRKQTRTRREGAASAAGAREAGERPLASPAVRKHALDAGHSTAPGPGHRPGGPDSARRPGGLLAPGFGKTCQHSQPLTPNATTNTRSR